MITITEDEKDYILNKHKDADKTSPFGDMKRHILDYDITPINLVKFKNLGLKLYKFSDELNDNFGFTEVSGKIQRKAFDNKPIQIYLLTQDEYDQISKFTNLVRTTIDHSIKKIELLKELIPSTMIEIMKKN